VLTGEPALLGDEINKFVFVELIDVCESGLINLAGFCVRFGGIGGGIGIVDDVILSVSFANVK
jgi:hypothetical protein